jgi:hypothetical protein
MRYTVLMAVFAACVASAASAKKRPDVFVTADRFEGTVDAQSDPVRVSSSAFRDNYTSVFIVLVASYKEGKAVAYRLQAHDVNNPPHFTDCHDLKFLVNGQPFPIEANFTQEHLPDNPYVIEKWIAHLTREQALTFAGATSVETRVCRMEVDPFDKGDIERLSKWKALVEDSEAKGVAPEVNWEAKK